MSKTLYQVAVLVDAGYLLYKLYPCVGRKHPTAEEIIEFTDQCLRHGEEKLFRIYFYDCPPLERKKINPIDRKTTDFSASSLCRNRKSLHDSLALKNHVAFRAGILQFNGWHIKDEILKEIAASGRKLEPSDARPMITQKRVDIKIGLDVAWLASKRIVDKLVLVTGDTDFIPAMKFARREGVQVIVATPDKSISPDILQHADEFRQIQFP